MTNYDRFFSRAAGHMMASAIRQMGGVAAEGRDVVSFAPRFAGMTAAEQWLQPSMLLTLVYRFGAAGRRRRAVPAVELTKIKRQQPGELILACHEIKQGRAPAIRN